MPLVLVTRDLGTLALLAVTLSAACTSAGEGDDTADDTGASVQDDTGDPVAPRAAVTVNEFQASNSTTVEDEYGIYSDWIELYNYGDEPVSLEGYTITDDLETPDKHTLGPLMIAAGEFLVLWADGGAVEDPDHVPFSLSREGEEIGLYDDLGRALCRLRYEENGVDWSAARIPDASENWEPTPEPTPDAPNRGRR